MRVPPFFLEIEMKYFFLSMLFVLGSAYGSSDLEQRVKQLEARVKYLESKVGVGVDSTSGLKVQDMGNSQIKNSIGSRGVSSSGPQLTEEQQKEITNTIELYKKRQQESQKILDELMNEP